jgi:hypothetical protein
MSLQRVAKLLALRIGPLQRLVAHRDQLLQERDRLQQVSDQLRQEIGELYAKLSRGQGALEAEPAARNILNEYVTDAYGDDLPFKIFDNEWSSDIPGYGLGKSRLFDDNRIIWIEKQCGGFAGMRILELGPLEGGHTYMMARGGAAHITSIEGNKRAFLKCLIVRDALNFEANFRLGDFRKYLAETTEIYDLLIASGVLYHMLEPVKLITDAARVAHSLAIWTHYYDADIIGRQPDIARTFDAEPRIERFGSRDVMSYRHSYGNALHWQGFCGGSAPDSYWLTRDSLFGALDDLGFAVTVGDETPDHVNGPAILIFASR